MSEVVSSLVPTVRSAEVRNSLVESSDDSPEYIIGNSQSTGILKTCSRVNVSNPSSGCTVGQFIVDESVVEFRLVLLLTFCCCELLCESSPCSPPINIRVS